MKHRWYSWGLAACLALVLMAAMAPVSAFAADAAVKINGVQLQDGVPVACGEGTAVLDQQQKTLTLTNATITQEAATPALDIRGGELRVVLVGENKIITGNQRAIYASNIDLVISGSELDLLVVQTDADAIQVDKGNLTIDGCKVQINSTTWSGITCWDGSLTVQNGAHVAIDCVDLAMGCDLDFVIADSTVEVVRNGDWDSPFFSNYGDVVIEGSTVWVDNPVACDYSTIYAAENVTISRSNVTAGSKTSIAVRALEGNVAIQDSVVAASSPANWEAVRAGGKITADNSWIQAMGKDLGNNFAYTNSAMFLNGTGEVAGNLVLPGSATIGADMQLTIPQGATVSVPAGVTLTNSGTVYVMGEVRETGGTIVCNSHAGGTATCQQRANCAFCGAEYGNLAPHDPVKTEASDPTCTDAGNREYYTCKVCGQYFADAAATQPLQQKEIVLPATGHNYQSGKCTLCGAIDPDYKPVESPNTGDSSATALWTAWLAMAGAVLGMACRSRAKKY